VEPLDGFEVDGLMMALEADADLQVLLHGLLGGGDDLSDAGSVDGDRLLHEDVLALADGFLEVDRAEAGRGGEDDDIGEGDGLLVGVEADEFACPRGPRPCPCACS
jgi:hypothetical protein